MSGVPGTCVIQVTNLSPAVTSEQMRTLFAFLGDVEELRLYPPDNAPLPFSSKVCYIKFREPPSVGVAQHLTNTVFIDRALIVVPCAEGKIPEEAKALSLLAPATTVATLMPGAGLLPIPTPPPLPSLGIPIGNLGTLQAGLDPSLAALGGISSQPPLMGNVDPSKIDEIRRTVYVGNLNSQKPQKEEQKIKKEERKEKIRERSRERNERERSPSRKSSKDKEKLEKNTPVKVERDSDKEEKEYGSDKDSIHTNHLDHMKGQQNGSYNNHEEDLLVQTEVSE
ncbi:UNVERIFIED_CONTAM: hypothetical protein FKN15_047677 [Acipenser sinensis]